MRDDSLIYNFDPQGKAFDTVVKSDYLSPEKTKNGRVTLVVTRYYGTPLPGAPAPTPADVNYQLFGALAGIHSVQNPSVFGDIKPSTDNEFLFNILNDTLVTFEEGMFQAGQQPDYANFSAAVAALDNPEIAFKSAWDKNVTYWLGDGSLVILDENRKGVRISCEEVPYRYFIDSLKTTVLFIELVRLKYTSQDTLDRSWSFVARSMLGANDSNTLTPQTYFDPNQEQGLIVDITQGFYIDPTMELNTIMPEAENRISWTCSIVKFSNNALKSPYGS